MKPQIWKPGQSGNPNGRPKGTKNNVNAENRDKLAMIFNTEIEFLLPEIQKLRSMGHTKDYCFLMERLAKYYVPTLQRVEVEGTINSNVYTVRYDDAIDITPIEDDEENED